MENGTEKVCRRCGTLNDARSLMCVRCGSGLDVTEEQKYNMFKGNLISGKSISFLFAILFSLYSFGMIFYASPWIDSKLMLFGETFIFDFYNNTKVTYITLEAIYTICMFLANSIIVSLILDMIINSKLMKRNSVNATSKFMCLYMLLCVVLMTIYKYKFDYIIILEHLVSIMIIFPYVKKKLFKRSV